MPDHFIVEYDARAIISYNSDFLPLQAKPLYKTKLTTIAALPPNAFVLRCGICKELVLSVEMCVSQGMLEKCALRGPPPAAMWQHEVTVSL